MQKGSGLASWRRFKRAFVPAIQTVSQKLGHTPRHREFAAAGYRYLVSAAYHHHRGYIRSLKRCGFPLPPRNRRPRRIPRPKPKNPNRRWRYWTQENIQRQVLRHSFRHDYFWGVMPASTDVLAKHAGLAMHFLRSPGGWNASAERLGLIPTMLGRRYRRVALAMMEAWAFYERERRWPHPRECSWVLKRLRFNQAGLTWAGIVDQALPPVMAKRVVLRGIKHLRWITQYEPTRHIEFRSGLIALLQRSRDFALPTTAVA